jgi:hypothetical protein
MNDIGSLCVVVVLALLAGYIVKWLRIPEVTVSRWVGPGLPVSSADAAFRAIQDAKTEQLLALERDGSRYEVLVAP